MNIQLLNFCMCKRLHPLLATAFQAKHFRKFLEDYGPLPETIVNHITTIQEKPSPEITASLEADQVYLTFMQAYSKYTDVTLSGAHGSTAKFWMLHKKMVALYLQFSQACHTNNLKLFIYVLDR